jgi:hypothetical protein
MKCWVTHHLGLNLWIYIPTCLLSVSSRSQFRNVNFMAGVDSSKFTFRSCLYLVQVDAFGHSAILLGYRVSTNRTGYFYPCRMKTKLLLKFIKWNTSIQCFELSLALFSIFLSNTFKL